MIRKCAIKIGKDYFALDGESIGKKLRLAGFNMETPFKRDVDRVTGDWIFTQEDEILKPGPTGRFPEGKLNPDDEGELAIAVAADFNKKVVVLNFGIPVRWFAMPKDLALGLAAKIKEKAEELP